MILKYYDEKILRNQLLGIISKYLNLEQYKVFYFGSRVKGNNRDKSDIDLGIEGSKRIPYGVFFQIKEEIDLIPTLYSIDLIDFKDCENKFVNFAKLNVEYIN